LGGRQPPFVMPSLSIQLCVVIYFLAQPLPSSPPAPVAAYNESPRSAHPPTTKVPTKTPTSSTQPRYKTVHTPTDSPARATPVHTSSSPPPIADQSRSLSAAPPAPEASGTAAPSKSGRT